MYKTLEEILLHIINKALRDEREVRLKYCQGCESDKINTFSSSLKYHTCQFHTADELFYSRLKQRLQDKKITDQDCLRILVNKADRDLTCLKKWL